MSTKYDFPRSPSPSSDESDDSLPPNPNHQPSPSDSDSESNLPVLTITSFGRKFGALDPKTTIQFNTHNLPIPPKEVRQGHTGCSNNLANWLRRTPEFRKETSAAKARIRHELEKALERGESEVSVGVFCDTGTHRSVVFAEELARRRWNGWKTVLEHRDIDKSDDGKAAKRRRDARSRKEAYAGFDSD